MGKVCSSPTFYLKSKTFLHFSFERSETCYCLLRPWRMQDDTMSFCVGIKIVMVTRGRSFALEMTDKQITFNKERWVHLSAAAHTCTSAAVLCCKAWRNRLPELQSRTRSSQFIIWTDLSDWINKTLFHFIDCYSAAPKSARKSAPVKPLLAIFSPLNSSTQLAGIIMCQSLYLRLGGENHGGVQKMITKLKRPADSPVKSTGIELNIPRRRAASFFFL